MTIDLSEREHAAMRPLLDAMEQARRDLSMMFTGIVAARNLPESAQLSTDGRRIIWEEHGELLPCSLDGAETDRLASTVDRNHPTVVQNLTDNPAT